MAHLWDACRPKANVHDNVGDRKYCCESFGYEMITVNVMLELKELIRHSFIPTILCKYHCSSQLDGQLIGRASSLVFNLFERYTLFWDRFFL